MMELYIHRYIPVTEVEGPGKRFAIWVQGCSIRCKGCAVPWTWVNENGTKMNVENLFEFIKDSKEQNEIEGVTFLGGEPFDQAEALGELGRKVKQLGLTVMTFTGYLYDDLKKQKQNQRLLSVTDLLIDGPFIEEKLDLSRPWVGSSNQNYHFLTDVYKHLETNFHQFQNKIEIRISQNGTISVNGMATKDTLKEILNQHTFKRIRSNT
ncbi:anaerobic ribonucleoside-triphosphate reductase-activating protein [Aeribacillus pallidus]|nr:anaerobic ribonucleoside-triphosphate reductase-activating protein [Aeribacillus pallidus]